MRLLKMTKLTLNLSVLTKTGLVRFHRFSENQPIDIQKFGKNVKKLESLKRIAVNFFNENNEYCMIKKMKRNNHKGKPYLKHLIPSGYALVLARPIFRKACASLRWKQ
jgi:hypothetical protein